MSFLTTTTLSIPWVKRVRASRNHYPDSPLHLQFYSADDVSDTSFNRSHVTVFFDDDALVDRLVAAINGAAESPCS